MEDKIEIEKKEYLKNRGRYLKPLEKQMGIKIQNCEFISNNEVFSKLVDDLPEIDELVEVEYSDIHSLVQFAPNNKYHMKYHNCITFFLPDGSHLRFSPHKKGLELTRLYIYPENQGKGLGTILMTLFLNYLEKKLVEIPEIIIELTGAVGYGKNYISSGIKTQSRFYEKFGFISKNYNNYTMLMIRPKGLPFV